MVELAKAIVFEVAYTYWAVYCGRPSRAQYGALLRKVE